MRLWKSCISYSRKYLEPARGSSVVTLVTWLVNTSIWLASPFFFNAIMSLFNDSPCKWGLFLLTRSKIFLGMSFSNPRAAPWVRPISLRSFIAIIMPPRCKRPSLPATLFETSLFTFKYYEIKYKIGGVFKTLPNI